MIVDYKVNSTDRKSLVTAISQELNTPTKYLGAPTFAYEIGNYRVDKNGTLEGPDDRALVDSLLSHDFTPYRIEYDSDDDLLIVEVPINDSFTPEKIDNLFKMVNAKKSLLQEAFNISDLPIHRIHRSGDGERLTFPWFKHIDDDHTAAYAAFIDKLCAAALKKTRVTAKEKQVEGSSKYAMRCFLLELGFIGSEYKAARKILLANLEGNSSWKNGKPQQTDDLPKIGDKVHTPRFLEVRIAEVYHAEYLARKNGFTEPTHFEHAAYSILGKSIGTNRMIFAAVKKEDA